MEERKVTTKATVRIEYGDVDIVGYDTLKNKIEILQGDNKIVLEDYEIETLIQRLFHFNACGKITHWSNYNITNISERYGE